MKRDNNRRGNGLRLVLAGLLLAFSLAACARQTPSPTLSPAPSETPTDTATPTVTVTRTLRPTVTNIPSLTPTITATPFPSSTPTLTVTPAPLRPAQLYPFLDLEGTPITWSYAHLTSYILNNNGQVKSISACLAFQLMDRAIHHQTIKVFGDDITVYYLNVQHQFGDQLQPMQLVIDAVYGTDTAIQDIPAGGSSYLQILQLSFLDSFDARGIREEINEEEIPFQGNYAQIPLLDFQALLPTLPDKLILLSDHAVLIDPDGWQQLHNDITSVAYLAARYLPFIQLDEYDRIVGPSPAAVALREFFLHGVIPSVPIPVYSSQYLVLITKP